MNPQIFLVEDSLWICVQILNPAYKQTFLASYQCMPALPSSPFLTPQEEGNCADFATYIDLTKQYFCN